MIKKSLVSVYICLLLFVVTSVAQIKLPEIFNDNMVLQRNSNIPVWGTAGANSRIKITFNGNEILTEADQNGKWKALIPAVDAGGPYELVVKEEVNQKIISVLYFRNVMIGDVWLASGQSNMEWKVKDTFDARSEISKASHADIRFFQISHDIESEPQFDIKPGIWKFTDSSTVGEFSAAAYFFACQIQKDQHVPIGIIQSTWGGTPVEAWTSKEMLMSSPAFDKKAFNNISANINQAEIDKSLKIERSYWNVVTNSMIGLKLGFTQLNYNDEGWSTAEMPKLFKDIEPDKYEGIIWLRKNIELPETMAGKILSINLGHPEAMYNLYINGILICENKWHSESRHIYQLRNGLLKKGKNEIVLRLVALKTIGGFNSPADSMYISDGISKISIAGEWKYMKDIERPFPKILNYQKTPSYLFNGMIHPIIPFGIKGCIWYQGEENASKPVAYKTLFPLMIQDWRARWQQGDFPFIYVQLANYMKRKADPSESNWALLRDAQLKTLAFPNTAMVTTIDIGEANSIHPRNKQDVGNRLALAAIRLAYKKDTVSSGPSFDHMTITKKSIHIHFKDTGKGLTAKGSYKLSGFSVAGADKKFYWANAKIEGDYVIIKSGKVNNPIAVRYAWADNPECNLYNKEGLPASPFRTDEW